MTEHTPGPWRVEDTDDFGARMRVMDQQEVTVALVYQQPFDTWTAKDNARLIAAAPALLEALEWAKTALSRVVIEVGPVIASHQAARGLVNDPNGHVHKAREHVLTAIKQAKGE